MNRECFRCHKKGNVSEKNITYSKIVFQWLCNNCFYMCVERFGDFKEEFLFEVKDEESS